ncbi:hypothetical protein B296_00036622, partial [Ensete ventricosum]
STAIISSSRGAAPIDPGAVDALAAMQSYFNVDSTVITRRLVEVRKNYFVPLEYKLHAPLPRERPYDTFLSGFNLSTNALKVSIRFPLHPVIEAFSIEWTSQMVNNTVPMLSVDETKLVEILQEILSASRGVKDMNEA